jgi:hypothetical protein
MTIYSGETFGADRAATEDPSGRRSRRGIGGGLANAIAMTATSHASTRVLGSTRWIRPPSATSAAASTGTSRHHQSHLTVHERENYWYVQCSTCDGGWQVLHYAAESAG